MKNFISGVFCLGLSQQQRHVLFLVTAGLNSIIAIPVLQWYADATVTSQLLSISGLIAFLLFFTAAFNMKNNWDSFWWAFSQILAFVVAGLYVKGTLSLLGVLSLASFAVATAGAILYLKPQNQNKKVDGITA